VHYEIIHSIVSALPEKSVQSGDTCRKLVCHVSCCIKYSTILHFMMHNPSLSLLFKLKLYLMSYPTVV